MVVAVLTAARAKSFAVILAQRPDRQGQKHLLAQHILKQQTVLLIITDFRLRRRYRPLRRTPIGPNRPEDQVELPIQRKINRLNTSRTRRLKLPVKLAPQADIRNDVSRPPMLVNDLREPGGLQVSFLLRFLAEINMPRRHCEIELDRLLLELTYSEFHIVEPKAARMPRQCVDVSHTH